MNTAEILIDAFGRIRELVHLACDGASADALAHRPEPDANSIAWLVWHLTRIQDDHVAEIAGQPQQWLAGWANRFGMESDPHNTGFGHTSEQVAAVRPDAPDVLIEYHEVVAAATVAYLQTVDSSALDRIIDERWDPPVSVGVRLVSVISDNLQHVGQARYLRGITDRVL